MVYFLEQVAEDNTLFSIFFWLTLLLVALVAFIYVMFSSYVLFYKKRIRVHFKKNDGSEIVTSSSYKKGKQYQLSSIKFPKGILKTNYELKIIKSNSDIKEGNLDGFIMPEDDVDIFYEERFIAPIVNNEKVIKQRYFIPVPEVIKEMQDKDVSPVVLLTLEDVKNNIRETNKSYLFPLVNNYKIASVKPYEVIVSYVASIAYAVLVYSEVTFKVYLRIDDQYVQNELKYIDSVSKVDGDIYSLVLDSSFDSDEEFYELLNHSYHYVLDVAFNKESIIKYVQRVEEEEYNSKLLQIVPSLPKEFDPVFEKACIEGKKYQDYLNILKKKERELDQPIKSDKQIVIDYLESIEDFIKPIGVDEYMAPINITEEPYVEEIVDVTKKKSYTPEVKVNIPSIIDELTDLRVNGPSRLQVENVIDFIVSRKEMANLTVDVSQNMKKEPTTLKFMSSYFALVFHGKRTFRIAMRHDKYVVNELLRVHPNIVRVRNGKEEDWYSLLIDDTYESYEELYSIFLSSYNYTKTQYYRKENADKENNPLIKNI